MKTGIKIKELRTSAQLTQKEFGDLFHVSDKTISKWERDVSSPDLDTIKAICAYFEVDVNYFFDNVTSTKLNNFYKYIAIASALLIPMFLIPLIVFLMNNISNQTIIDIVIVIYVIILSVLTLVSLGLVIWKMITILKGKQDKNGFVYFKGFFLYFVLFQIGFILVTNGFVNFYFSYIFYLPAIGVLVYLVKKLHLKMTLNKPSIIVLVFTCISFIMFIITPRAAIEPWTQKQAFIIFLILTFILLRLSVKPRELTTNF
ncbi:MAG: helix-turn-helix domain-containing protein [Bacillota bacterium]